MTVNRFKKNLDVGQNVADFIPPCLKEMVEYFKSKDYLLRNPGPGGIKHKTRITWAGDRLVLQAKVAGDTAARFRVVCRNENMT